MSSDFIKEKVFPFVKRIGDIAFHGSNNNVIILGTDRASAGPAGLGDGLGHTKADGSGKGSSTVHIIAGRNGEDPNLKDDASYLYLSQKTSVDTNLEIKSIKPDDDKKSAAILKADAIRIYSRESTKIVSGDDKHYIKLDSKKIVIKMGDKTEIEIDDSSSTVKINSEKFLLSGKNRDPWDTLFQKLIEAIQDHDHVTAVGPTGPAKAGPSGGAKVNLLSSDMNTWKSGTK